MRQSFWNDFSWTWRRQPILYGGQLAMLSRSLSCGNVFGGDYFILCGGHVIKEPIMWKCFFMGVTSTFYYGRDGHFITKTIMWEWYRGGYRVDVRTSATNLFYIFKRTHSIKVTTAWSIKRTLAILTINIAAQHMITSINYRVYFEHTNSIQVIYSARNYMSWIGVAFDILFPLDPLFRFFVVSEKKTKKFFDKKVLL